MNYCPRADTEAPVKSPYQTILCPTHYSLKRGIATVTSFTTRANENGFVNLSALLFII